MEVRSSNLDVRAKMRRVAGRIRSAKKAPSLVHIVVNGTIHMEVKTQIQRSINRDAWRSEVTYVSQSID